MTESDNPLVDLINCVTVMNGAVDLLLGDRADWLAIMLRDNMSMVESHIDALTLAHAAR